MIILDLEWNRGYDKNPLDEILQIGAVRLDRPGGPITGTFNAFIRPRVHKKLNRAAKALPEVKASQTSDLDFPTAYGRFLAWCGGTGTSPPGGRTTSTSSGRTPTTGSCPPWSPVR